MAEILFFIFQREKIFTKIGILVGSLKQEAGSLNKKILRFKYQTSVDQ
jgi:hypothetical protein